LLKFRAFFGRVATVPGTRSFLPKIWTLDKVFEQWPELSDQTDLGHIEQIAASFCAAVEAITEESGAPLDPEARKLIEWLEKMPISVELSAYLNLLYVRAQLMAEEEPDFSRLNELLSSLTTAGSTSTQQRWFDWRAPASLIDRLRLQLLL